MLTENPFSNFYYYPQRFFKSLSILFNIYAVNNYTELENKIESSSECKTIKLFMFINCGGFIDLTAKWFLNGE